jgi:hypothetical protein
MEWNQAKKNVNVNLMDMKPNPKNPRKDYSKTEMKELKENLQSLGQKSNCVLDHKGIILVGHRRHFAAKQLGWETLICNIEGPDTSIFEKSAIMLSSNVTQLKFNAWEHREAVSNIYWNEFLEEYKPRGQKDKGYSSFARKMGLSPSYVKKIVEAEVGENKTYYDKMKKAGAGLDTVDEVLTAPEHLRGYLVEEAVKRQIRTKGMESNKRRRDFIRGIKRKAILEDTRAIIDKRTFRVWIDKIEEIGVELDDYIIEQGNEEDLIKLELAIRKHILGFYNKLVKNLGG